MTLGLVLNFFDFRNDVRALIGVLSKNNSLVIYVRKEHVSTVKKFEHLGFTIRVINEEKQTILNWLVIRFYLLFKKLPASAKNYYLMEAFKASALPSSSQKRKANIIRALQQLLPKFYSYDRYLDHLSYSGKTDLNGIDEILLFTEIYDDFLMARIIHEKIKSKVYVYSWDHPCKHTRFSNRLQYLVWNKDIADDVMQLQNIAPEKINVLGATQFGYLYTFQNGLSQSPPASDYYYYGCGIGIPDLLKYEIAIIVKLAEVIKMSDPSSHLFVRPYPNLKNWSVYDQLKSIANVKLDDGYRQGDFSVEEVALLNKFHTINGAKGFFHIGTTLGLEACFTQCPSFILDVVPKTKKNLDIYHFIHQYQNEKYLLQMSSINTITSWEQLKHTIEDIHNPDYLIFNHAVRDKYPLLSFETLAAKLINQN